MRVEKRIKLLEKLGEYMLSNAEAWDNCKYRAENVNSWFTREFIDLSVAAIATQFLDAQKLQHFAQKYSVPEELTVPKTVGIVMAGNIPLVGFHDFLCVFLSGHRARIKSSSKDPILLPHLTDKLIEWEPELVEDIVFSEMLKNCDAYIATGSNNTARYFDFYFSRYPHIIRRNRSSVAVLTGHESATDLEALSDAINLYFGLGCRNVTKLYVPEGYNFEPLVRSLDKYRHFIDHNKYHNNYDYQLAIALIDHRYYMTNGSVLLIENGNIFSPISQLNYELYADRESLIADLSTNDDIQCITGNGLLPFGQTQQPSLTDYADKIDTMEFLITL
jgi:hypothetical protein